MAQRFGKGTKTSAILYLNKKEKEHGGNFRFPTMKSHDPLRFATAHLIKKDTLDPIKDAKSTLSREPCATHRTNVQCPPAIFIVFYSKICKF